MAIERTPIRILILLSIPFLAFAPVQRENPDSTGLTEPHNQWLERGYQAEREGDYEKALRIWSRAREELEVPSSQIGLEYIRLAAEHGLREWYAEATSMYFWAISRPFEGGNREAIRSELRRLQPLAGNGLYRQWAEWFEKQNPRLAADLRGFWVQLDPTPGESINERLIEHWRRIAWSRAHFRKNSKTIFGTDDRALVYVRYGEPDQRHTGRLILDEGVTGRRLARLFDTTAAPADRENSGSPVRPEPGETPPPESAPLREREFDRLEEYLLRHHFNREYEIWIYRPPEGSPDAPLIFLFGEEPQSGEFGQIGSLDDLIPEGAFSDSRYQQELPDFARRGLTPALALQLIYYEQVARVEPLFQEPFRSILSAFYEQPSGSRNLDQTMRNQNRQWLSARELAAPRHRSSVARLLPRIPVDLFQYRLLDQDGNPLLVSFLESRPGRALVQDREYNLLRSEPGSGEAGMNGSENNPASTERTGTGGSGQEQSGRGGESDEAPGQDDPYLLTHHLVVYDLEWNEMEHLERRYTLPASGVEDPLMQSHFISRHNVSLHQTAATQLFNTDPESSSWYPAIFPDSLRGAGIVHLRQPEPLQNEPNQLELADLLLGYRAPVPEGYPFPFRVANRQKIPGDQSLLLHFEVYNLEPAESGYTGFELTYRIFPVLEDGTLQTDQEAFYLTIGFEHDETRLVEDIEIQTTQLASGMYELQVYVEDSVNGKRKERKIRFEVIN